MSLSRCYEEKEHWSIAFDLGGPHEDHSEIDGPCLRAEVNRNRVYVGVHDDMPLTTASARRLAYWLLSAADFLDDVPDPQGCLL